MMPTGTSSIPARTLKPRRSRKSTYACSSSSSPAFLEAFHERVLELEFAHEADASLNECVNSSTNRWKSSTPSLNSGLL